MTRTTPDSDTDSEAEVSNSDMGSENNPQQARDHIEQLEWLIHMFFEAIRKPWFNIKRIATYLMVDRGGYKTFDDVALWLARHPLSSLFMFIISLFSLPFLVAVGFAIGLIAITFTGFIVLESTMLTFISVISFGCLGALIIALSFILAIVLAVYMGFRYIYDMYGSGKASALTDYLRKEHAANAHSRNQRRTDTTNQNNPRIDSIGSSSQ